MPVAGQRRTCLFCGEPTNGERYCSWTCRSEDDLNYYLSDQALVDLGDDLEERRWATA